MEKIVDQVTIEIQGVSGKVRLDYFGKNISGLHGGDAKSSTKVVDWNNQWLGKCTTNQIAGYQEIIDGKLIRIHATDPQKILDLNNKLGITITNGLSEWLELETLKIIGSKANLQEVKTIVEFYP
jgi:hypothetical protein